MAVYTPLTVRELIEILKLRHGNSHVNVNVFAGVATRDIKKGERVSTIDVAGDESANDRTNFLGDKKGPHS